MKKAQFLILGIMSWLNTEIASAEFFVNNGLCLSVDQRQFPNPVMVETCIPEWSNQKWGVEKTTGTQIINAGTQLCLDVHPSQGLIVATPCDEEKFYALQPGQLPTQKWQIVTVATDRQIGSPPVKIRSKMDPQLCITIAPALGPTGWGKYVRLMPCMPDNLYQLWRIIY